MVSMLFLLAVGELDSPGRFSRGAQLDTIVMAPLIIPAAPRPAMARPIISIKEEFANPHSSDPSSKTPKKKRKVH